MTDLAAAAQFVAAHGRLLERRRIAHLLGDDGSTAGPVLAALEAYFNPDGGVGFLEPDLRTPASQPSAVLYALDVLAELGDPPDPALTTPALDWLQTVTNSDGGVPFVLPTAKGWPHAPWWTPQDDPASSLLMTAGLAAAVHRLGLDHPWLAPATTYVWDAIPALTPSDPYTFRYAISFLDAVGDRARAGAALDVLAERVPEDGVLKVASGIEGETLGALEVAPRPDHAGRRLFGDELIERELDHLAEEQRDDGGWTFSWAAWNPAVAWEWRGMVTVEALKTLRAYGRL
ncbi:MAG TPA: hypothetical protein VK501_21990 [Baekduia sp.]|uniref:hypothetical protein n=1 Tax=Baekduia sp. TaxID=2600305 RepID=UPI002CA206D7|nr:hypothetical protein [Baekduia sp.]HMJ36591.1 hypothetical protein [Baekduia sp.]